MSLLKLEIRLENGTIKVYEEGATGNPDNHSQTCREAVRWKRGGNNIESWVVQFVGADGLPLRPEDSPFEDGETKFEATGGTPDFGVLKSCGQGFEAEYKYTVACTVTEGSNPEPLDPILVIKDNFYLRSAIEKIEELSGKVDHISRDLQDVTEGLREALAALREAGA